MFGLGLEVEGSSPERAGGNWSSRTVAKWSKVVKEIGVKVE